MTTKFIELFRYLFMLLLFELVQICKCGYFMCTLAKKLVCSPDVDKDDMKRTLEIAIKSSGLETDIRNVVFHLLRGSGATKCEPKTLSQCVSDLGICITFERIYCHEITE